MKNQEYLKNFANKVKCMRERQGISQEKLAEKAGLHRTYIGMVERVVEKARLIDPFGHAGFDPSGKIKLTP